MTTPRVTGSANLRVLGVDPGLTRCGLGVIDVARDRRASLVGVGVVGTSAEQPLDARLLVIANAIEDWLERYEPEVVAVERVFSQLNVSTVMGVAQASGVVIAAAARRGIPVALHTPSEVKAAVTGSGRADKEAVTRMVTKILRLDASPRPADAADALALALAHAWRGSAPGSPSAVGRTTAMTATAMTPAQRAWTEAESRARRKN
ncbi:MAG: crossover junction endodeoxyribonuclease RuvC [Sinomonas sp.]|jgi:crossover junction endodeoxyribonuclease RuvC|nr:crossover junction endodeoxyribonuclease RuvC [Sinomonas sp.]